MIDSLFQYNFLQNALYSAIMASIICGIIGTIIVEKNLVMMSGGIAHTSFGGVGLGYYLQIEPIIGGLLFAIISAAAIVGIRRNTGTNSDALIGIFWSVGMALGILFISFMPGYPPDLTTYLFGDILTVSSLDLRYIFVITVFVLFFIMSFFNYWKAYLFDEEFLKVKGVNIKLMDYFLFILIALSIVVIIRVVGIILAITLLTAPASIARLYTDDLKFMMVASIAFGILFNLLGLIIPYNLDIASGAAIILLAAGTYFGLILIKKISLGRKNYE
ncbi:MAG: metal ABC transporter permease [Halanaerobiales bacterium]